MKKSSEITVVQNQDYDIQLRDFEKGLLGFLDHHNLPIESILVPVNERVTVFKNIENVLAKIDVNHIRQSVYVSKFLAAIAAGLFDAALNYLWDETILELRRRVAQYDLSYFFDSAVSNPDKRKNLNDESDLVKLNDSDLIYGAREIELISDIGFQHLDYIRYMRNWSSVAHPNQNQLTGLQLVSWLETCIREVISLPLSNIAIEIRKLLANIKSNAISNIEAQEIGSFFLNLTQDQVNNLASGFFGIYTRQDTTRQVRLNIRQLLPLLWDRIDETTRHQFGIKYGKFAANNDQEERKLAREFLQIVSAENYIPDGLRAAEIQIAIDNLLTAHRGHDNFYSEPPFARQLERLVGGGENVPPQVSRAYVLALVEVFLTNGNGVAWNAEPIYISLIEKFDPNQARLSILSFSNANIASRLQFPLCQKKYRELLILMKDRVTAPADKEIIEEIESYRGSLTKINEDPRLAPKIKNLFKIIR